MDRLGWPGLLPHQRRRGDRPFFQRKERLSGIPVKEVDHTGFSNLSHRIDISAILINGYQIRMGWQVIIPDIVTNGLKIQIGRASCRERMQSREVAGSWRKK